MCRLQKREQGFSMLEVLITTAIVGIVTAIVVVKYGAFNSSVLLRNQAYEVALAVREAQVFSLSIRGQDTGSIVQFRDDYGVYFDLSSGSAGQATLFFDRGTDNAEYDAGDIDVDTLVLDSRFEITHFCVTDDSATELCSNVDSVNQLAIVFERPDFDANISVANDGSAVVGTYTDVTLTLDAVTGASISRTVRIESTGQITVQ